MTEIANPIYQQQLQDFFHSLRSEITNSAIPNGFELENLEQYILELNTFYYQSFAQTFLPQYQTMLTAEWKKTLQLKQDEASLTRSVFQIFYAYGEEIAALRLSIQRLTEVHKALISWKNAGTRRASQQANELYQSVVYLLAELKALLTFFRQSIFFAKNMEVRLALKQFPGHVTLVQMLSHPELENKKNQRFLQQLLINIKQQISLLKSLSSTSESSCLAEMEALAVLPEEWMDKKTAFALKNWYQRYFQLQQNNYLMTCAALQKLAGSNFQKTVSEFEAWLGAAAMILDAYFNSAFKQIAFYTTTTEPLEKMGEALQIAALEIERWTAQSDPTTLPLQTMVVETQPLLASVHQLFSDYNSTLPEYDPLISQSLENICEALNYASFLQNQFHDQEQTLRQNAIEQMIVLLHDQLEKLQTMLQDIEKCLTEKNFRQRFAGLSFSLEQITIEPGRPLSQSAYAWMQSHRPQHLPSSPEQIVSFSTGDIWILTINPESEIIFPNVSYIS